MYRVARDDMSRGGLPDLEPSVEATLTHLAEDAGDMFSVIAKQATHLLGVELAGVVRFEASNIGRLVGVSSKLGREFGPDTEISLDGNTASAVVQRTGRSARVQNYASHGDRRSRYLAANAYRSGVAVPIYVGTYLWGALGVATTRDEALPSDVEDRLTGLAELVALALANSDSFARVAHQALLDTIFKQTPVGLGFVDLERRYAHINVALAEIHGRPATADLGRPLSEVIPDLADELEERCVGPALDTGQAVLDVEVSGETSARPGECRHWLVSCYPARIGPREIAGVGVVMLDITERKRSEAERERLLEAEQLARSRAETAEMNLERKNAHLVELDRIRDQLVAFVSHELRTPLTAIRGYLELILDDEDASRLSTEQREYLGIIERNSHRLMQLASDLLVVAQADAGRLDLSIAEVDLETVVRECLTNAQPRAAAADITLTTELEPAVLVPGDHVRLSELLDNLVSNAIKFTHPGGGVVVRVSARNGYAVLEVQDTGSGIPLDQQPHIFDRFFRVSDRPGKPVPGTGLGLAIAKMIARAHGGRIGVHSAEGAGANFWVELPTYALGAGTP